MCVSAPDSKASGKECNNDVDSMMPTDRLTIRSTIFESKANEKNAAAAMLTTPAMVVVSRIDARVVLISYPVASKVAASLRLRRET